MAISKKEQVTSLEKLITKLQKQNFFGNASIKMQDGNIIQVIVSQSIKLEDTACNK